MILGMNTNHDRQGKVFHVQTEDSGVDNPVLTTHCFVSGTIIETKKTEYRDALGRSDLAAHVKQLARAQHREMVALLDSGRLDKKARLVRPGGGRTDIPTVDKSRKRGRKKGRPGRPSPPVSVSTGRPSGTQRKAPPPMPRIRPRPDTAPAESIEALDSLEIELLDDDPLAQTEGAVEYPSPLLEAAPLDPVVLAYLLEDDAAD